MLPHVAAMFIVDCGPDGFDETMLPEMGVALLAIAGDWTWGTSPSGRQSRLGFATLIGPQARAIRVTGSPQGRVAGFALSPLGWSLLVDKPAHLMMGRAIPMEDLFDEADELVEHLAAAPSGDRLTERLALWLEQRLNLSAAADPSIARLSAALADPAVNSVEALAAASGLTRGMLDKRCPGIFGLDPESLIARQTFLHALRGLQQAAFEDRAAGFHGGYPDEAAFRRAFRAYMGQLVEDYLASPGLLLKAGLRAATAAAAAAAHQSGPLNA
jgi:AraC-like DNA-binding protein